MKPFSSLSAASKHTLASKRRLSFILLSFIFLLLIIILINNVQQHRESTRLATEQFQKYKRRQQQHQQTTTEESLSPSPQEIDDQNQMTMMNTPEPRGVGRPSDPSKILILSSSAGLHPGSKSSLFVGGGNGGGATISRGPLDQTIYRMTEYIKNKYVATRGYQYIVEGDDIVSLSSSSLSSSTSVYPPVSWARVLTIRKYLEKAAATSLYASNSPDWITWMSNDVMIMNLDFEIEAILENIPAEVDIVIGVNQLEPSPQTFLANSSSAVNDNNDNNQHHQHEHHYHDSKYFVKDFATSKTRRKFAVDPGVIFFRTHKSQTAYDNSFTKHTLDRISTMIADGDLTTLCPTIPKTRGERGVWQCIISHERQKHKDGGISSRKILVVKNQKLFNSFYFSSSLSSSSSLLLSHDTATTKSIGFTSQDFIARVPPTVCGTKSHPCLDIANEAFDVSMRLNHLDKKEFRKFVTIYERMSSSSGNNNNNHQHNQKKSSNSAFSSIGILSVLYTASSAGSTPHPLLYDVFKSRPVIYASDRHDLIQLQEEKLRQLSKALSHEYAHIHHYDRIHEVVNLVSLRGLKKTKIIYPPKSTTPKPHHHIDDEDHHHQEQERPIYKYSVPSKKLKKAVELAKILLKYLPKYDWIYLLPGDAFIFEMNASLERLLLIDLENSKVNLLYREEQKRKLQQQHEHGGDGLAASASTGGKEKDEESEEVEEANQKDLIITKQLKSATVSEDTFFIRNSRWTLKILREFLEKYEDVVDHIEEDDHHLVHQGNKNSLKKNREKQHQKQHEILRDFKGGLLQTIVKPAVDIFWKSKGKKQQQQQQQQQQQHENKENNNNDQPDAAITTAVASPQEVKNNNVDDDQHIKADILSHTYFMPDQHLFNSFIFPTDRGHQASARYNAATNDFLGRLVRCYSLDLVSDDVEDLNDEMIKKHQQHAIYHHDHEMNQDGMNNNDYTTTLMKPQQSVNNLDDSSAPLLTKPPSDFSPDHCYNSAESFFEKILLKRYPKRDDRDEERDKLMALVQDIFTSSIDSAAAGGGGVVNSHHEDEQGHRFHVTNKNLNREVVWKKTQPGVDRDDLNIDDNNNNDGAGSNKQLFLQIPQQAPSKNNDKKRKRKKKYRVSSSTAILTVLCSSIASVHHHANEEIDPVMNKRARADLQDNIIPLHKKTFESKLAYAQLHGYDIIVEDCHVLDESNNDNNNNNNNKNNKFDRFGSLREHQQWAKLVAVYKWMKYYDRLLVLDAGIMIMDFDKSIDDIEKVFLQVRRASQKGNKAFHQDPILMVSSDIEGVSTAAMLWKNVTTPSHNNNNVDKLSSGGNHHHPPALSSNKNKNKITTSQLLLQLLSMASSASSHGAAACADQTQSHADKGALRCLLNHAMMKKRSNINHDEPNEVVGDDQQQHHIEQQQQQQFTSLDAMSAIIVDRRDEDRFENRRGNTAHGTMRLLFSTPKSLMPIAVHNDQQYRYRSGDFTVFLHNCFLKLEKTDCERVVEDYKTQSHDLNHYGVIADPENEVPLLLKPKV